MQTINDGTHDILPAAAPIERRPDRARVPVTMPRQSDGKMRRDGSSAANAQPKHSVAERGGVHGASELEVSERQRVRENDIEYLRSQEKRRWPEVSRKHDRLGGLAGNRASVPSAMARSRSPSFRDKVDQGAASARRFDQGDLMKMYVGLDVSMSSTSICVVDETGKIVKETKSATEPEAIAAAVATWKDAIERIGLEAQSFSPWLAVELIAAGLPAVVVETFHMKRALSAMRNKTDRADARGIAQMLRVGWFRPVHVKSAESQQLRFLLSGRRLLKRKFIDVENELRGALKAFGLVVGTVSRGRFETRVRELLHGAPAAVVALGTTLLSVRRTLFEEFGRLHKEIVRLVGRDEVCRRFMSVPGVGPITALAFKTAIDDPTKVQPITHGRRALWTDAPALPVRRCRL